MPRPVWQRPADLRPGPSVVQGGTLAVLDASPNLIVAIDPSACACEHRSTMSIDAT